MLPRESTTTKPAAAPHPSLASLRARPVLRSSGLRIGAGLRDMTKAARTARWTTDEDLDANKPKHQHDEQAAGIKGVPLETDGPRGTPKGTDVEGLFSGISLRRPMLHIPSAQSASGKAVDKAKATTHTAGEDEAIRDDKAAASGLLSRMVKLYVAHAPKDGRSAFETSLRPFVYQIPLDDPLVPGLLVPNAEAGPPSLPQLAQALLAFETSFHKSSKSAAFVACYERWRSQVRSARRTPPTPRQYPLRVFAALPTPSCCNLPSRDHRSAAASNLRLRSRTCARARPLAFSSRSPRAMRRSQPSAAAPACLLERRHAWASCWRGWSTRFNLQSARPALHRESRCG